jgi:ABC-2 type transport system ATP-binding protein
MQKRLAIAAALQKDAEIVLLDEPYDRLDAKGSDLVDGLVTRLRAQGRTVLLATHALHGVRADHTLVLESGRLEGR